MCGTWLQFRLESLLSVMADPDLAVWQLAITKLEISGKSFVVIGWNILSMRTIPQYRQTIVYFILLSEAILWVIMVVMAFIFNITPDVWVDKYPNNLFCFVLRRLQWMFNTKVSPTFLLQHSLTSKFTDRNRCSTLLGQKTTSCGISELNKG